MFLNVVGGLGLFLLGMKNMSEGMQTVAGSRLRHTIGTVTNNRLMATGVGLLVTCVIQSSSVTTVMTVGFVNAGLMTLRQAIGVIMGANIGTTLTGWILVVKVGKYGLPMLGIAALFYLFSKREKWHYLAMAIMGLGMVFFGLELMKNGFKPIKEMESFARWFHYFSADNYFGVLKCAMAGCLLTCIVQSSSATLGITMGLASTGVIPFETAAALVLGENIGTTITAYLASLGATTNAKRAAYAHIVFNMIGVFWITLLFTPYMVIIRKLAGGDPNLMVLQNGVETYPRIIRAIAMTHSGFNITNTLVFLPFVNLLAKGLTRFVPDRIHKEVPHLTHLDIHMIESPVIGTEQCRVELMRMGDHVAKMLAYLKKIILGENDFQKKIDKLLHREEVLDIMQKEVAIFLTYMLSSNVPLSVADEGRRQLRIADEYESAGDYIASILKHLLRIESDGLSLPEEERKTILELHDRINDYVVMVNTAYAENNVDIITKADAAGMTLRNDIKALRAQHLAHLSKTRVEPQVSTAYTDMLNAYNRIEDHMFNIAEALAGRK
ncbi:MAG: Na/Pi cotransporter family protein [Candidatus Hydrogenedentes bacterium]|nr:Na/Pi cotransporter family protein [Candidatus Hydrogenedentota bacterium]